MAYRGIVVNMKKIIVKVRYGLANRLRVLSLGWILARLTRRAFFLVWEKEPACGADFLDLFVKAGDFFLGDAPKTKNRANYNFMYREGGAMDRVIAWESCDIYIESAFEFGIKRKYHKYSPCGIFERVFWRICESLRYLGLRRLKLREDIRKKIVQHDKGCELGVHLRTQDFKRPDIDFPDFARNFHLSKMSAFVEKIRQEIKKNPKLKIFLSSNDPAAEEQIKNEFGERVFTYPKQARERDTDEAIQDALIDMYLLSRTSKIIGTNASSFSEIAAALGGIPLEVIK